MHESEAMTMYYKVIDKLYNMYQNPESQYYVRDRIVYQVSLDRVKYVALLINKIISEIGHIRDLDVIFEKEVGNFVIHLRFGDMYYVQIKISDSTFVYVCISEEHIDRDGKNQISEKHNTIFAEPDSICEIVKYIEEHC